jgi:hypothetical protein
MAQSDFLAPIYCRSWLASEGGQMINAVFKGAFAGKPAPTMDCPLE